MSEEDSVVIVERIYKIEDYYRAGTVVKAFRNRKDADAWVAGARLREAAVREAFVEVQQFNRAYDEANPFVFGEEQPPRWATWPQGKSVTPEMRAERTAARNAMTAYHERHRAAQAAHAAARRAALEAAWSGGVPLSEVPEAVGYEPTEYEIHVVPLE